MKQEDIRSIIDSKERQIKEYRELIKTFKEYDKRRKRHYKSVLKENERLSALVVKLQQKLKDYDNDNTILRLGIKYKCCLAEKE